MGGPAFGRKRALDTGVKVFDHGQLADDSTARLMAAKGIRWVLQPFLVEEDAPPQPDSARRGRAPS